MQRNSSSFFKKDLDGKSKKKEKIKVRKETNKQQNMKLDKSEISKEQKNMRKTTDSPFPGRSQSFLKSVFNWYLGKELERLRRNVEGNVSRLKVT